MFHTAGQPNAASASRMGRFPNSRRRGLWEPGRIHHPSTCAERSFFFNFAQNGGIAPPPMPAALPPDARSLGLLVQATACLSSHPHR